MKTNKNKYKEDDVMYGVFDVSMLSLRQTCADNEFRTLEDTLEWIGMELDNNADEDSRYEIVVCAYDYNKDGWYPVQGAHTISVDARYFTPVEDFISEDCEVCS